VLIVYIDLRQMLVKLLPAGSVPSCAGVAVIKHMKPVPDGMFEYTVPECTWAIFPGAGNPQSIQELQKRIFAEWLPTSGYEWSGAADVEVYLNKDPVNMKYEVWMPVVKKA
jgi:predicted transcriptional regulator YdeE